MVLLDSDMHQGLCFITTFMKARIGSRLSSIVMFHYAYVYKLFVLDYDINYKVLQGLGLVNFINGFVSFKHISRVMINYIIHPHFTGFCHIFTIIIGYVGMQCS